MREKERDSTLSLGLYDKNEKKRRRTFFHIKICCWQFWLTLVVMITIFVATFTFIYIFSLFIFVSL